MKRPALLPLGLLLACLLHTCRGWSSSLTEVDPAFSSVLVPSSKPDLALDGSNDRAEEEASRLGGLRQLLNEDGDVSSPSYPSVQPPPPPTPIQEIDSVEHQGSQYAFYGLLEGDRKDFNAAKEDCRSRRSALVTVTDGDEHKDSLRAMVEDYFTTNPDWQSLKFWVGYTKDGGNLVAVDGSNVDYVSDRLTGNGMTNNGCVFGDKMSSIAVEDLDFKSFTVGECNVELPYMCKESSCTLCDTCVSTMYDEFTSKIPNGATLSMLLNGHGDLKGWNAVCQEQGYAALDCDAASVLIAASRQDDFNFARRPAALCRIVQDCKDENECKIIPPPDVEGSPTEMNFCTKTGANGGDFIGNQDFALSGVNECINDSNCDAGKFCDASDSDDLAFKCDPKTGLDESRPKGTCKSLCDRPAIVAEVDLRNRLFDDSVCVYDSDAPEDQQGTCVDGFVCRPALAACRTDFRCDLVNDQPTIQGAECEGMCFKTNKEMERAKFTDSGDSIQVTLSTRARAFNVPCSRVFDKDTNDRLGTAQCSVSPSERNIININLGGDATIEPGQELKLCEGVCGPLRDFFDSTERYNAGVTVSVDGCDTCKKPTAMLSGPSSFREPCPGEEYIMVTIDSSSSSGMSGRALKSRTWDFKTDVHNDRVQCEDHDITDNTDLLSVAVKKANDEGQTELELGSDVLEAMDTGFHCFTLTVTSFLGEQSDEFVHVLEKQESDSGTPSVRIIAPAQAFIGSGVVLSASVDTSSVCGGEVAEYQWRCVSDDCPLLGGPEEQDAPEFQSSVALALRSRDLVGTVMPGSTYRFRLTSRITNSNVMSFAEQEITLLGDRMVAAFTRESPSGERSRGNNDILEFDASPSNDRSDPTNIVQAMRFSFRCERPDGISSCFTEEGGFYTGEVEDGNKWKLEIDRFVEDDDENGNNNEFIITVTISKGSETNNNLRTATARRTIRLRPAKVPIVSARIDQDCGESGCSGTSLSTEALVFDATIVNLDEFNDEDVKQYKWNVDGETVLQKHLLTSEDGSNPEAEVDSPTIVLKRHGEPDSIIPRSGEMSVECEITVDTASGTAGLTINLEGPPICTRADGECLALQPDTSNLPNIMFRAQARGFSAANDLIYEFGFKVDNEFQVDQGADVSNLKELQAQQGAANYMVYTVAVDAVTRARSAPVTATFELGNAEPEGENCEEKEENFKKDMQGAANKNANFGRLKNTGDNGAVRGGVASTNGLNNAKVPDCVDPPARRRLLEYEKSFEVLQKEGLDALLGTLESNLIGDALGALTSIQDTFPVGSEPTVEQATVLAQVVAKAMKIIGDSGADDIGTVTIRSALRNAGQAAEVLRKEQGDTDAWERVNKVMGTLMNARSLMRRAAVSGQTSVAASPQMAQAVSRNTRAATAIANVVFDVSVMGRDNTVKAGSIFASESQSGFQDWCASDNVCAGRDRLSLYLSYVRDAELYTKATTGFPKVIPDHEDTDETGDPAAISGIFEVQFDFRADQRICSATAPCTMELTVPLIGGVEDNMADKAAACVRLDPNMDESTFTATVETAKATVTDTYAICEVTRLGRYVVMSYTPPPSDEDVEDDTASPPPPGQEVAPPTETPSPAPPPPTLVAWPENECSGLESKSISANLTFSSAINTTLLSERLTRNLGRHLGLADGLQCDVEVTPQDAGGNRRSLLSATSYTMKADLGSKASGTAVFRARTSVNKAIEDGTETFVSTFVNAGDDEPFTDLEGNEATLESASLESPTDTIEGCGAASYQFEANIELDGDSLSSDVQAVGWENAQEQLQEQLRNGLDAITRDEAVVIGCPATFELKSDLRQRRALLSETAGVLTVDMGEDLLTASALQGSLSQRMAPSAPSRSTAKSTR